MSRAAILASLAQVGIALLRRTLSVERLHFDRYLALRARRVPIVFSLWHGRMFLPIQAHRHQGIVTLASRSGDGEIITRWLEKNGYVVVRGSTRRGGGAALRRLIRHVRSRREVALTVDGPKGPARVVKPGVVRLARLTGAWIVPVAYSSSRPRFLDSWDRYLLPEPFSRNFIAYGEPFPIDGDLSEEEALGKIACALDATTREADRAAGISPPEPWS
ncbi:MAG TPA: lysophospholipid acyltransferase family protein [candidate division Zixibacteria bacterium]|nr:lysophospholipid acyltransferase family protein [candidate division Zixibacteria bacterium]